MPVIVRPEGFHQDVWRHCEAIQGGRIILPWKEFCEQLGLLDHMQDTPVLGVLVPNTVEAETILPHFNKIDLIAISFPSFADGRGFSLARCLRQAEFAGTLRASGHLIADQFAYALQCGFDEVEISDDLAARQPEEQWTAMKDALSLAYQPTFTPEGTSILERRKANRA